MVVAPGQATWRALVRGARPVGPAAAARLGPWLILAPHPDDESLGCGALLAMLAARGADPRVAFLTDGARSHEGVPAWSARRIAAARREEAAHALRALGVHRHAVHLDWPDAQPWPPASPEFVATIRHLASLCRRLRVRALATTWAGDPHCDHAAAAAVLDAVVARLSGRVRAYQFPVWGWTAISPIVARAALSVQVSRTDRARQHRAIACHRTQTGTRILGVTDAFRLPRAMIALARRPRLVLLRVGVRHAA